MTEAVTPADAGALLVVSAHAGDFVWRSGGAIALAAERGQRAKVVCLSYGERGQRCLHVGVFDFRKVAPRGAG